MKTAVLLVSLVTLLVAGPVSTEYAKLLDHAVCSEGVNYSKLSIGGPLMQQAEAEFLAVSEEEFKSWSEAEQIAWYSNLYNFYTIKLIVERAPRRSIQDIGSAWDIKFVPHFGKKVSLNYIEHTILRKRYYEPRIHFALNCASIGCPALRLTPFTGGNLVAELDEQAVAFLKDETKNRVEGKKIFYSQIFQWYGDDFKKGYGSYEEYVKGVLSLSGNYRTAFTTYDWDLNRATCK